MPEKTSISQYRSADYPIDRMFLERWSPRSMSGESISREALLTLFEAARWAPSSGNGQPWRFFYALRGTGNWPDFLDLLNSGNRVWCEQAAALVVIVSKTTSDRGGKPSPTHSFDAGAAWMSLALQGDLSGLVVHGMAGFDYAKARELLQLPEDLAVEAMCAIGVPAPIESLPENLREREKPSGRKSTAEFVFEGKFSARAPQPIP